jgi:putative glycerol-1-phosphate prenyltransferase
MKTFDYLREVKEAKGAGFLLLLDPDRMTRDSLRESIEHAESSGVDAFLFGTSLMTRDVFEESLADVKKFAKLPVIIFPGNLFQISSKADAILYISVLQSRNVDLIIRNHVHAAPLIKFNNLEAIPTAYLLVESGKLTTAQFMSDSIPIPRNKPEIAAAYAMAAEMFGMKMVYLEAGSGAQLSISPEMISTVTRYSNLPVIVGGGIRNPETASEIVQAGASFVVTGNFFEDNDHAKLLRHFADAIHFKERKGKIF